jgi:colicin import membrane protein
MSVLASSVSPRRIILRPILATLFMHGLMIYALTVNWSGLNEREIVKVKPAPKVVNARLVDISEFRPKPNPKPKITKPRPVAKPKPAPKVQAKPRPAPKPVAKPKPRPVAKPEPKPEPRMSEEELATIARAELARTIARDMEEEVTASAEEMAASYAALIQQTVVNYWSRPPSARNGMEALLLVQLIPTGEVVSVNVVKSSGNSAFDRSAINAVEKAGAFPELKNLPTREFERTFRRFRLLFRPEDLRY